MTAAADSSQALRRLPLLTLYLTDRCNSRCVTCDYWRHGRTDMSLAAVRRLIPHLQELDTRLVLVSGGEPLLHPEWSEIAECLKAEGLKLWLLTSGLSLAKHARRAATLFDAITVSMDGTDAKTYAAIRGLDAFDKVCEGVRAVAAWGRPAGLRVTLQRANYRQWLQFVALAHAIDAAQVSFLAVDVSSSHAFGRLDAAGGDSALLPADLPVLDGLLQRLLSERRADLESGFIAENPRKLRRIAQYFSAVCGHADYPAVRCNAPEFSAVVDASGSLQPCFFIQPRAAAPIAAGLDSALNGASMRQLRADIRGGARPECRTCVCSLWREPNSLARAF